MCGIGGSIESEVRTGEIRILVASLYSYVKRY